MRAYRGSATADEHLANKSTEEFQELTKERDVIEKNIYNIDETGLLWRVLPSKMLMDITKKSVKGYKSSKERITVVLCTNASGTHKLMPLVIYKCQDSHNLKHHNN
jgi:hypothetical protein